MLFRKMMRDIRMNKAQFIAIFLMIFLGVFIFAGVNSEWNGMQVTSQQFYKETTMADVLVYGNGFTQDEVNKLKTKKHIQGIERRAVFTTNVKENTKQKIELNIVEENTISAMKLMEGERYTQDKDGIWLDRSYAQENDIHVGDVITLTMKGMELTKTVKGIILHPEYVYQNAKGNVLPDHKNYGYAFISHKHCPYMEILPYNQLVIHTKKPTQMERIVSDALARSNLTFVERKDILSYSMLQDEITQHQAFGEVFPIVFLLIAVLTTLTTVSKMIMNQRLQIGILKALGFSNRKIKLHYLSHIVVITVLGAVLGYLCGPLIVPALIFPMMKTMYVLPQLQAVNDAGNQIMVIGSIAFCFLAAYFVCRRQLKEKAVDLLRPALCRYNRNRTKNGRLWKMLSFYAQWNIRDIMRNKVRSFIAVLGVAGCSGLMLCAFGLQDSMNHMMDMMFKELQTYEMRVNVEEQADIATLKKKMDGSAVQESALEIKHDKASKTGSLMVLEDNRYIKLQNEDQKETLLPENGVALSYKIAQTYGLKRNDTIAWRMIGSKTWHKSVIKEIIHTPSAQGITMSKQELAHQKENFTPTMVVGKKANVTSLYGVSSIQYMEEDIKTGFDTMMDGMNLIIVILMMAAVVLGVVVLYNIGTFSYMEKIHDMATLKVLGFRSSKVKKLLRQQNAWLTFLGILGGLPFGYALIYTIVSTIGDSMDIRIVIQPRTYLLCVLGTMVVSMLVIVIVSRKIKSIDMVSALKANE